MARLRSVTLAIAVFALPGWGWAQQRLEFDFEQAPVESQWQAAGKELKAERQEVAAGAPADGPAGHGLTISAAAPGGVFTKLGAAPADLSAYDRLEFWVHRSEDEVRLHPQAALEAQALGPHGARYWRRVDLGEAGWHKISLPLSWFRWGNGHLPDWKRIDRMGLWLRGAGELQIDNLALVDDDPARGAALNAEDVIRLAFGNNPNVKQKTGPQAIVASDAQDIRTDPLVEHLEKVAATLDADLPELGSGPPAVLLVFGSDDDYRSFSPRLGAKLGADAPPPKSDGYTLHGVATAAWSPRFGTLRPVYTHEFVHAYLIPRLGFDNQGDWLHEGLAARTQLRFHTQPGFERIVHTGLAKPEARTPLATLCNGRPIPVQRYWQAATLVDMLLSSPDYAPRRAALIEALRKAGSADLGPHLQPVLQTDWAGLEADWKRWCEEKYGASPHEPAGKKIS